MSISHRTPNQGHSTLLFLPLLLALAAVIAVVLHSVSGSIAAPAPQPTVDPQLVLHSRTLSLAGRFSDGGRFTATLFPSIPGQNTLQLQLHPGRGVGPPGGAVTAVATMPGMAMIPAQSTLTRHGASYIGRIRLSMFGRYTVRLMMQTTKGREEGSAAITLTLPIQ